MVIQVRRGGWRWGLAAVLAFAVSVGACTTPESSGPAGAGDISIEDAWVRAGSAGGTTAAYMTIRNAGAEDDRLLGANSPAAGEAQVHETRVENGQAQMVHMADGLVVPAGGEVQLAPEGYHVMMMGLGADLAAGGEVNLVLQFERAGTVTVAAKVMPMDALGPEK